MQGYLSRRQLGAKRILRVLTPPAARQWERTAASWLNWASGVRAESKTSRRTHGCLQRGRETGSCAVPEPSISAICQF